MAEFSFKVEKELGNIGQPTASGWQTKLTLVSWNGREPKYDIRSWSPDMTKMGKGISFTRDELLDLNNLLYDEFNEEGVGVDEDDEPMSHEEMLAELAEMGI